MKRFFLSLSILGMGLFSATAFAQNGVYLTAEDFANKELRYDDVNAHIPFRYGKVKVTDGNKKLLLDKNDVYGYRQGNQDYRIIGNNAYKVLDAEHFHIYSRQVETSKGKGRITETQYYFSAEPGSELQPLTIANLKKAFPDNDRFHQLLDLQFRHNNELAWYDDYAKKFKIKSIYTQSI
ncbi:hypothetical protein [Chitinophaga alhagiae]|uniref:hypothetical protein n=1 Tax=Chitinophaga alhagiae TaxID=2203219 RepID=UPI000E5B2033|nr:hypothetical protein [Chitinophaga alhagiae]